MNTVWEECEYGGFSALSLQCESLSCVVIPELGGKIVELLDRRTMRNWLWQNEQLSLRKPRPGVSYVAEFDTGGWDEILPTIDPCRFDGTPWSAGQLTDHGEIWCRPWSVETATASSSKSPLLTLQLNDAELPIHFQRTIALDKDTARLTISYLLVNRTSEDVPYIWAAHPLLAVAPGDEIVVSNGTRAKFHSGLGECLPDKSHEFVWPNAMSSRGVPIDYSSAPSFGDQLWGTASKIFLENSGKTSITVSNPTAGNGIRFYLDGSQIPYVGLWMNYGCWSGTGGKAYYNLGIEPTTVPGDSLADSIKSESVSLLPAEGQQKWAFELSLVEGHEH